jgi:hypothetical protein
MPSSGPRSPRSPTTASSPKFDVEALRIYIRKLLQSTLSGYQWPDPNKLDERDRVKAWGKEIGERVKERMLRMCFRSMKNYGFESLYCLEIESNGLCVLIFQSLGVQLVEAPHSTASI